ncbi:hypothetical protein FAIPA1_10370 [Frankia sp. AiPs1]|uniref:DUF4345 domain-containing protein n=1 Tax=Frankia sp. AiPa1 TaxID=573492 RepID=UPI00202B13DB|nr:DUF4345 domain-containing protein [Frankia sp. AiPa1]MCL9759625.1 DUF4345 domain-containing protein [Frankia sp. AiPa1]
MDDDRERRLAILCQLTGATCVAISAFHLALGTNRTVLGAGDVTASVDSHERFVLTIFGGYGLAWLRAARGRPVAVDEVRALSALMAAGGASRLISLAHRGRPHWFHLLLAGVEFALPAATIALTHGELPAGTRDVRPREDGAIA